MSLGENIYRLRTAKNMSQGSLAEALDVSRQSISKWETDGATPELDKLTKLVDLFDVTLDELVTGKAPKREESPKSDQPPPIIVERREIEGRKVAGVVLLCMAAILLLTSIGCFYWKGLWPFLPVLFCGAICLTAKKNPGLWCGWVCFLLLNGYRCMFGAVSYVPVEMILHGIQTRRGERLIYVWCLLFCAVGLIVWTVWCFRDHKQGGKDRWSCLVLAAALLIVCLPYRYWLWRMDIWEWLAPVDWLQSILVPALLVSLLIKLPPVRGRKQKP